MKKILVIGAGKWGKIVLKKLKAIADVKMVINTKKNYKDFDTKFIDWVFILTPDTKHYSMVKFFLKKKVNIFCEKPLTNSYKKSLELVKLANKIKINLYIDDIENFKKNKIRIKKINYIRRLKKDTGTIKSILNRLVYHDMYLLSPVLDKYKKLKIDILESKKFLNFLIFNKNISFNFLYSLNSNKREHSINSLSLSNVKVDALAKMLNTVLYKKINYKKNHNVSLFASKMIDNVRKKL
tara:strand:- start:627 stop:1343 length:717 start_codon:yes stop_codon:yes gene_type:complete